MKHQNFFNVLTSVNPESNTLEWLGTHPAGKTRVEKLENEKEKEEIKRIVSSCAKLNNSGPLNDYLSIFNYEQELPTMSLGKVKELLSK